MFQKKETLLVIGHGLLFYIVCFLFPRNSININFAFTIYTFHLQKDPKAHNLQLVNKKGKNQLILREIKNENRKAD